MSTPTRRDFLRTTRSLAIGAAALSVGQTVHAAGANDKISIGIIGPGGRGTSLYHEFMVQKDVDMTWVCDIDDHRAADAANTIEAKTKKRPKITRDLREVLADKSLDAVIIATPDHWHAPATILACDAGKHVYVEKPASHNLREGRLMIEPARRNKRIVQIGTQSRSAPHVMGAMQKLRDGAIGDVLVSKAWNSQRRGDIGKQKPSEPPKWIDYDAWVGPAELTPYQPNRFHSVWRWCYNFGVGDIGNDGVHDIDIARWGLGVEQHPSRICALGGKYFFDDDQQFPDTYNVCYEYDLAGKKKQLIYEQRIWSPYFQEGAENGNAFYGTKGMMLLSKQSGYQLFGPKNKLIEKVDARLNDAAHVRDFLDCIKSGGTPHADIEIGHLSSSLSHLGNIAIRAGRMINFDPQKEMISGDEEANGLIRRKYREGGHWAVPKNV